MDKCLGFGGVGDCFIIILKLLEYKKPFVYTHIDTSNNRLRLSMQLLDYFGIQHDCKVVSDIREWWYEHAGEYKRCFNVFARGHIHIPHRPYHWQPCVDEGYHNAFSKDILSKFDYVAVQINSGGDRNYKSKPIVQHVTDYYEKDQILWFGTDKIFNSDYGTNYCGKLELTDVLDRIAECKYFVGFNSVLLYWALYNKTESYLFTDHQGKEDLRIHDEWKKYITYDV